MTNPTLWHWFVSSKNETSMNFPQSITWTCLTYKKGTHVIVCLTSLTRSLYECDYIQRMYPVKEKECASSFLTKTFDRQQWEVFGSTHNMYDHAIMYVGAYKHNYVLYSCHTKEKEHASWLISNVFERHQWQVWFNECDCIWTWLCNTYG